MIFRGSIQNLMTIEFCWRLIFEILVIHKPSLGPIGSAVLTFFEYKQTDKHHNKQTDAQAKYTYKYSRTHKIVE